MIDPLAWIAVAVFVGFTILMLISYWRAFRIRRQWCDCGRRHPCPEWEPSCRHPADGV